ncbi:PAS domain-containing protein [Antarctobacter sp.]|uniref:PAS domain-containing protein n=1 Tax=Antarctobacter sp. TaxID=1872577 RepID=UPI003A8EA263
MPQDPSATDSGFDQILRDLLSKRAFSDLGFEEALLFFCQTMSNALDAPRVGIWLLNEANDSLRGKLMWDRESGVTEPGGDLTAENAGTYLKAVVQDLVIVINDALTDPRCAELAQDYLPNTNVRALLDCPLRTFGGLAGVVCIEDTGQPRQWTTEEINFATAVAGLISLTIEHNERVIAEKAARALEDRLKLYTDLATDWFWETDTSFRFERLHGSRALDGQMPADYIGHKLWEVPILTPLAGTWDGLKKRVTDRKRIFDFVVSAMDSEGNLHFAEIAGVPTFDDDGTFCGYWGTAKDVTQRVQHEQDLAASEQKYKNAARLAKLASWIWDKIDEKCTYCSPELAEIFGVSVEEFLRRSSSWDEDLNWYHPDDREMYAEASAKATRNKVGYDIIVRVVLDDGTVRTLHETTEPIFNSSGRLIAISGVLLDITDKANLQDRLKAQEDRLKSIIDNISGAAYRVKYDQNFTSVYHSSGYLNLFVDPEVPSTGWPKGQSYPTLNIDEADRHRIDKALRRAVIHNQPYAIEYPVILRDGSEKWVSDRGRPVKTQDGQIELEGIMIDATEKHAAQEALAHGQRLEAIGKLTGGIAHDFNNLLAVILGNLELLRDEIDIPEQISLIDSGIGAVRRGADLTRNMLAFARKSRLNSEVLDLNDLAGKAKNWIGRTLPANISVETSLLAGLWKIEADASSTESAFLNLVLNARDAMPKGGKMTIETSNVRIDEDYIESRFEDMEPGRYVMLAVSDNGEGIPEDRLEDIFEPFFTTKPPGSGSGLGLSMILGFMKQSGGSVRVYSEPGVGTTFKLYFKALTSDVSKPVDPEVVLPVSRGLARILVVEDDTGVLAVLESTLIKAGYDIRTASSGDLARDIFEADPHFDLLLTDIVMPGALQGTTLAKTLRAQRPELKVIFMSGYASEATVHGNGLRPEDIRLMKPIGRSVLIQAIEKALD